MLTSVKGGCDGLPGNPRIRFSTVNSSHGSRTFVQDRRNYSSILLTTMSSLEALSDPVRLEVVRHLERCDDASLQELADAAGVHLNTVRPHVAALEEAGAVVRES